MALDMSKLIRIGGGSGVNMWYYASNDALSVVRAANYFSTADATGGEMNGQSALGMMNAGDIVVLVDSNSTHKDASITVVKEVSATAIDLGDGTTISSADSD
jgi:hypothetical protein|tara:strand:- start:11623 stop:11928 length:306 start_codon:yes stop_codon:yes gene_type:complete